MIYLYVLILLIALTVSYDFNSPRRFSNKWYNFVLLVFILIAGLRYKVGGDTQAYFDYYKSVNSWKNTNLSELLVGTYSFLWNVFATLCKTISDDFAVLQVIHAIFVNITLFWFIKKYSKFRFSSLLIYFLFAYLYFNMEILRESLAICFFLLAYPYFEKKSWLKYYAIAIVAFLFHTSAVIIFLFPAFRIMKFSLKNLLITSVFFLLMIVLLANNPHLTNFLLVTDTISSKFNLYSEYSLNLNGKILVLVSFIVVPLYFLSINKKIKNNRGNVFESLYMVYFIIAISYLLFSGFSRFVNYMTPFMIIYFSDTLNSIYLSKRYSNMKRILVISILTIVFSSKIYYYKEDTSRFYPNTTKFNLYYPYSSILTKDEFVFREIIFLEGMNESMENK